MKKNNKYKIRRGVYFFFKTILYIYLKWWFRVDIRNKKIKNIKPPFLIISNHMSFWDPFFMAFGIEYPINFVVSDAHYRINWLRRILKIFGGIPKTKKVADSETIRAILTVKNRKGVIGLYPEGVRSWDGEPLEITIASAKLIKSLKIPVISTVMQGAMLSKPRWARASRRGKVIIEYKQLLSVKEISELTIEEIHRKMIDETLISEYNWQSKNMIAFKGKNRAEFLDLFLYVCPHCKEINSLFSKGNNITCKKCGYSVTYNNYGYLENNSDKEIVFKRIPDWSKFQDNIMEDYKDYSGVIFKDLDAILWFGNNRRGKLLKKDSGVLSMYRDKFVFEGNNVKQQYNIDDIKGFNIQNNNKFEFYVGKTLVRFTFTSKHTSAYKWANTVNVIKTSNKKSI